MDCQGKRAFIFIPPLASAHDLRLLMTPGESCSPKARCHSHHKPSSFLVLLTHHWLWWQQHKQKSCAKEPRSEEYRPLFCFHCKCFYTSRSRSAFVEKKEVCLFYLLFRKLEAILNPKIIRPVIVDSTPTAKPE